MYKLSSTLLTEITEFQIDSESGNLTFTKRLCRENKWTDFYAQRCIREYKRFVYLAMVADHPVTPSDQIDQVWHLHLTYTRSYWSELCEKILKSPLHHCPTKGGQTESNKFRSQYQATLNSYKKIFKEDPPMDIWPSCQQRFHNADTFVRINSREYVLLKKRPKFLLVIAALPVLLTACAQANVDRGSLIKLFIGSVIFSLICVVFRFLKSVRKNLSKEDKFSFDYATLMGGYVGLSNRKDKTDDSDTSGDGGGGDGCGGGGCGGCGG